MLLENVKEVEFNGEFKSGKGVLVFKMDNEERVSLWWRLDDHWKEKIELNCGVLTMMTSEFDVERHDRWTSQSVTWVAEERHKHGSNISDRNDHLDLLKISSVFRQETTLHYNTGGNSSVLVEK